MNDNCPPNCVLCSIDELEDESVYPWEWDEDQEDDEIYEEELEN